MYFHRGQTVYSQLSEGFVGRPRVGIVILNWNGWRDTVECLESLCSLDYADYQIVVVDNGSTDGSVERIGTHFPDVAIIATGVNLGFPGGCNVGIAKVLEDGAQYVLLLNNDTLVESGFLDHMLATAICERAGIVGSVVVGTDGRLLFARRWFPRRIFSTPKPRLPDQAARSWASDEVDAAAMLLSRQLLEERMSTLGYYLDPRLFLYCEEIELCHFARTQGYPILVVAGSPVVHKVGQSSGGSGSATAYYYLTRNRLWLARRLLPWPTLLLFQLWWLISRPMVVFAAIVLRRNWRVVSAILAGWLDGYRISLDGSSALPTSEPQC